MIKIEYNFTNYEEMFRHFARCLKLKLTDDTIRFTPDTGDGTIRLHTLQNGLYVLVYNCVSLEELQFHRKKSNKEYFVLRLDEVTARSGASRASLFFGKTTQDWYYTLQSGMQLKQLNILLSKQWLDEYFSHEEAGQLLNNYITLKTPLVIYELLDAEYKRFMNEMMTPPADAGFEPMIVQNRVMLMLERFFTRLYKNIESDNSNLRISAVELKRIKDVEAELLKDFSQPPPSIAQLARIAAMSPSKLKILFKEVFGYPVNQYYQRHRLNKAKAMLISKKYSVRETAHTLGFSSVSSLNKAFLKTFDQMPAELTGTNA